MYKTVRHGENSLQYTILPQTEEVLSNSGLRGKGRDYSPSIHVRRGRRRSTVKYVLLIVFGTAVALALAAVPLYVMNGALYARRSQRDGHEAVTAAPLAPTGREIVKSRKKELKMIPIVTVQAKLETSSTTMASSTSASTTTAAVTTSERVATTWPAPHAPRGAATTTIAPLPTDDNEIPLVGTPSGTVRMLDRDKPWDSAAVRPTVAADPVTVRTVFRYYSRPVPAAVTTEEALITTKATTARLSGTTEAPTTESSKMRDLKDAILSVDDDDDFKESLEVDEVFSLPPLKPEVAGDDEVTVAKAGWYGARWPFVDTSSYFQWTGYSPGDNLLLPLLVAALSSLALVLLLALAVRRRRTRSAAAHLGLTADLQADDNTNLLTAENPEEGEE